jgi:4-hydroxy-tetrahydrodipicolinate reductase
MGREVIAAIASPRYSGKANVSAQADVGDPLEALISGSDIIIDFSAPAAGIALAQAAEKTAQPPVLVIGSTGWKIDERKLIEKYAERAPVILASNFSTGVLVLMEMMKKFSPVLEKLGYTPVIVETHHKHKKDSPSGTALSLQRMISLSPGNVQTQSVRAGEVIGDHEVTFYGPGDRVTAGHFAQDRSIFATGAIDVALWLHEQRKSGKITKGLTGLEPFMKDLLA